MNTIVEQKIYCENPKRVYQKAVDEVKRLEGLMSFFRESSDISKINQLAGKEKVKVSSEVIAVLREAYRFSELSDGAFDITLAPVIDLWRRYGKLSKLPCDKEIDKHLAFVGYNNMKLDENEQTAYLVKQGCAVDLGGIAKGFAADACVEIYKSMGVKSAFINLGGNVKALGNKPDGDDWVIGIQHPDRQRGVYLGVVLVSNKSVVTSGTYERYFEINGKKYHHILDCKTGCSSESDIKSITVICESGVQADALSTAALVMGLDDGLELVHNICDAEAIFVTKDNKIYLTKGIKQHFYLTQQNSEFSCYIID